MGKELAQPSALTGTSDSRNIQRRVQISIFGNPIDQASPRQGFGKPLSTSMIVGEETTGGSDVRENSCLREGTC